MKSLAKSAFFVIILLIISKVLGLLREIVLANQYGTSYIVDAYAISISFPSVLFSIIASGYSNSYIPIYSRIKDRRERNKLFSSTMYILVIASVLLSLLCVFISPLITNILAPGFEGESRELTIRFIRIIVTILPFMIVFNILCAQSQANEDFIFCYFCDYIVINIFIIVSIFLSKYLTIDFLAIGYVLSTVIVTILLFIYIILKKEGKLLLYCKISDKSFMELTKLAIPLGLSIVVNQINSVVDKMFSSNLGEGITSALSYADRIQLIPLGLTVSVIISVCYPRMNKLYAEEKWEEARFYTDKAITMALFIGCPFIGCVCLFSQDIVCLLFENGAFTSDSTIITAQCLLFYSVGIPFYALREIASKVLASNMKQKIILKNTIISVVVNILLNIVMVNVFGYWGLALATSITGFITFLLMVRELHHLDIHIFDMKNANDVIKIIISTLITVGVGVGVNHLFILHKTRYTILIIVLICFIVYLIANLVLKTKVLLWSLSHVSGKNRFFKRK